MKGRLGRLLAWGHGGVGLALALAGGGAYLFGLPMLWYVPLAADTRVLAWLHWVGAALFAGGVFGWLGSVMALRFIGGGTPSPWFHPTQRLVRVGPYRRVRHPIYLGLVLMALGRACWDGNAALVGTLPVLLMGLALLIAREERSLRLRFGADYQDYQEHTARLIPLIY